MEHDAKVTVLLPVFNGMEFLAGAIDSVLAQTSADWRLYCIDDGSSDGSVEFLRNLHDSRIDVIIRKRNAGLYGVLNEAVRSFPGDYFVILMQDDLLKPNFIEKFLRIALQYPHVDVFWGSEELINFEGVCLSRGLVGDDVELIPPSIDAVRSALLRGCIWTISGSFTRASYLRSRGFRSDLPHASDWDFILHALREVHSLYLRDSLVTIRVHSGQTSNRHAKSTRDLQDYQAVVRDLCQEMPDVFDASIRRKVYFKLAQQVLRRGLRACLDLDAEKLKGSIARAVDLFDDWSELRKN